MEDERWGRLVARLGMVADAPAGMEVTVGMDLWADLGLDSLARIELAIELEEEFGVEVMEDAEEDWHTVGDIWTWIQTNTYPMRQERISIVGGEDEEGA